MEQHYKSKLSPIVALTGLLLLSNASYAAPVSLANQFEGFESSSLPEYISISAGTAGPAWSVTSERAYAGTQSLVTSKAGMSTVTLVGTTPEGSFSFRYFHQSYDGVDGSYLTVEVDGDPLGTAPRQGWWHEFTVPVSAGEHTITIRFSNGSHFDEMQSLYLDNFSFTDTPADDGDQDSVVSWYDNCSADANADQANFDNDVAGDVCDPDDDNDGISDSDEAKYAFLNSHDASDAVLDQDNDGISNAVEIGFNLDPSVTNASITLDLFPYYPLGQIKWHYESGEIDGLFTTSSLALEATNNANQFKLDDILEAGGDKFPLLLEYRDDGIYVNEGNEYYCDMGIPEGVAPQGSLVIPAELRLDRASTSHATGRFFSGEWYDYEIEVSVAAVRQGVATFEGDRVKTIEVEVTARCTTEFGSVNERIQRLVLGEHIGPMGEKNIDSYTTLTRMDVDSINFEPTAGTNTTRPVEDNSGSGNSSAKSSGGGGGSLPLWFVCSALSLAGARHLRKKIQTK